MCSSAIIDSQERTTMASKYSDNDFPSGQEPIRTSNIARFAVQADLLRNTEDAPSVLGIVTGPPGTGKTIAAQLYLAEEEQKWQPPDLTCVMLDIMPQETTKWILDSIAHRISDMPRSRTSHEAFQQVLTALEQRRVRLLMLDNADYLSHQHLEALHALIGKSTCSVLLIGLPRLLTGIKMHPQLDARVGLSLPILPLPDEEVFATFLPQLHLPGWAFDPQNETDLQMGKYLWRKSCPSLRRLRVILASASQIAQLRGTPTITLETIRLAVHMIAPQGDPSGTQSSEEDM